MDKYSFQNELISEILIQNGIFGTLAEFEVGDFLNKMQLSFSQITAVYNGCCCSSNTSVN
jgi:hypothetical protein